MRIPRASDRTTIVNQHDRVESRLSAGPSSTMDPIVLEPPLKIEIKNTFRRI